jgi:hypothetical protein
MKYRLPLMMFLVLSQGMAWSQSFFDDFESYAEGAYIAQSSSAWTTWGNDPGSAEDAQVSTEQAFSGIKSLKLASSSGQGGPTDILLPFGQVYAEGHFYFRMMLYIELGTGGYFNFQANAVAGQVWATEFYFRGNGFMEVRAGSMTVADYPYPHNQWMEIVCALDLTNNIWEAYVDDELVASWSNPNNQVASLNLYPFNQGGTSLMYVDDVSFEHTPFEQPDLDLSLFGIRARGRALTGQQIPLVVTLRNLGMETIEDVDITWFDSNNFYTEELQGLSLGSGEDYTFTLTNAYTVLPGPRELLFIITNVNGGDDDNPANNERRWTITGVTPAPNKRVLAEEGTGTWCGFCPRGTVFMDSMAHTYPDHFVPVAVHYNDPMVTEPYSGSVNNYPGFGGYPNVIMDRSAVVDPSAMEDRFFQQVAIPANATLHNGAALNTQTDELTISVTAEFTIPITGNWRLNVAITEDSVRGSGPQWAQTNYYSGGGLGPMGGWELLPNPVPASLMRYDHVARAILGGFGGEAGSLPSSVPAGGSHTQLFTWTIPSGMDPDNMHIVSMLIQPNGRINNARSITLAEALDNGIQTSTENPLPLHSIRLFPNPTSDHAFVHVHLSHPVPVQMRVVDILGRIVYQQDMGSMSGEQWLPLPTLQLSDGMYLVQLQTGTIVETHKLQVKR